MTTRPIFSLATTGTDPKLTTKQTLEEEAQRCLDVLHEDINGIEAGATDADLNGEAAARADADAALAIQIQALVNGSAPRGNWDASSGAFPSGSALGNRWYVTTAGTVNGVSFAVGDQLVALVASASTSTYAANWVKVPSLLVEDLYGPGRVNFRGTTAGEQLALAARKPRKLYSKLYAAASGAVAFKLMMFGDSLAVRTGINFLSVLEKKFGAHNIAGPNTTGAVTGTHAGFDCDSLASSGVTDATTGYSLWPHGNYASIAAGGYRTYNKFGASAGFTKVSVFYLKETGAGTIELTVAGVSRGTANAGAAASGVGVLEYTQAYGQSTIRVAVSGAAAKILFVHADTGQMGANQYFFGFAVGGWAMAAGFANSVARANLQEAIDLIDPDMVTFEVDDNFVAGNSTAVAFQQFEAILIAAAPYADKVIIGSTPRSALDAGKLASSEYLRGRCAVNDAAWLFFDSYHIMGSYADMAAIFGADDGVHPDNGVQAFKAEQLLAQFGLPISSFGYSPNPVNDRGRASLLASGTLLQLSSNDTRQLVATGSNNGYEWLLEMSAGGALTLTCGGQSIILTNGITGKANQIPFPMNFGSTARGIKNLNAYSGVDFLELKNTGSPNSRDHLLAGLFRNIFTRAELLAIPANVATGSIAYCSDATGGAGIVWARGSSPSDWVKIDGGAAI